MTEMPTFTSADVAPERSAVLALQGMPAGRAVPEHIGALFAEARALLARIAAPAGLYEELPRDAFGAIYAGEGRNEPVTPVGDIHGRAARLALFAVTLGAGVSREIEARFAARDLALAAMLDAAASIAADRLAAALEARYRAALARRLARRGPERSAGGRFAVLRYSPGYCGWHVSGQRRLFARLHPERIGITLGDSCLMQPLKSVSGVLIAGAPAIHDFPAVYPFCRSCETRGCRERIRALQAST